ncbi:hypothetical protein GCM10023226_35240 [Nocardioides nanhaiensis]|uniref:Uncharacterized protein n=1 Tax=Nocardioides nanhaiensis TaxID=1476871 RepID=A0ABP8WRZ1_9ACTN
MQDQEVADQRDVGLPAQSLDREHLRDDVDGVQDAGHQHQREQGSPSTWATGRGRPVRLVGLYRRSSRCLHVRHSVARGKAINRIFPIGSPHDSQRP